MLARSLLAAAAALSLLSGTPAVRAPAWDGPDGRFSIDAAHSAVIFKIKHLGVSNFYGRFNDLSGMVLVDAAAPAESLVSFTVKTASVNTHNADRDKHLQGADFFNAEEFGTIEFESETVTVKSPKQLEVAGSLKLHGVEKALTVTVNLIGFATHPIAGTLAGYETRFTIKRSDFGMKYMLDALGDEVEMIVSLEGVKK